MILYLIIATLFIMLASLSGVILLTDHAGRWMRAHMTELIAFSAGLFAVVVYGLVQESFELLSVETAAAYVSAGFLGFFLLSNLIPEGHHHASEDCGHRHNKAMASRILMSDAIHNVADGILLVPAFLIDVRLGIATAAGVFLHEFIQEISEFIILRDAGWKAKKALIWNFAVSGTVIIGILLSVLLSGSQQFVGPLLAISAGAFLFIAVHDLVPRILRHRDAGVIKLIVWAVLGAAVLLAVGTVAGHGHEGDGHGDDHEDEQDHALGEMIDQTSYATSLFSQR